MRKLSFILVAGSAIAGLTGIVTGARNFTRADPKPEDGIRLQASFKAMTLDRAEFTVVAPDRLLATVGDTLYMLDLHRHIVWKQTVGDVVGQPFAMPDGSIHVLLVQDKVHLVISAATGKTLKCIDCNTTARTNFTQVLPYNQNQYLVVETDAYFRRRPGSENTPDEVALWQGDRVLWTAPIPPDAEVRVVGNKILAVEKKEQAIVFHEVVPVKIITAKP
jgi:hypothetical protein